MSRLFNLSVKHWDLARDYRSSLFLNIGKAFKLLFSRCFFCGGSEQKPCFILARVQLCTILEKKNQRCSGGREANASPSTWKAQTSPSGEGPHTFADADARSIKRLHTKDRITAEGVARTVACRRDGGDADTLCWARSRMKVMTPSRHPPCCNPKYNQPRPATVREFRVCSGLGWTILFSLPGIAFAATISKCSFWQYLNFFS